MSQALQRAVKKISGEAEVHLGVGGTPPLAHLPILVGGTPSFASSAHTDRGYTFLWLTCPYWWGVTPSFGSPAHTGGGYTFLCLTCPYWWGEGGYTFLCLTCPYWWPCLLLKKFLIARFQKCFISHTPHF